MGCKFLERKKKKKTDKEVLVEFNLNLLEGIGKKKIS